MNAGAACAGAGSAGGTLHADADCNHGAIVKVDGDRACTGTAPRSDDREALVAGAAVLALYALFAPVGAYAIGTFADDGVYMTLGRALADGHGYRQLHMPGEPAGTYPPGVPLLFALMWRLGGSLQAVQTLAAVTGMLACGVAAGLLWWIGRACLGLSRTSVAAFVVAPLLLYMSLQYYSLAMSEPYFLLAWAGVLALYYAGRSSAGPRSVVWALALGAAVLLATTVRVQGVVLLPAMLLALFIDRRSPVLCAPLMAGFLAPVAAVLLVLQGGGAVAAGIALVRDAPHGAWLPFASADAAAATVEIAATNLITYLFALAGTLLGMNVPAVAATALLACMAAAGVLVLLRPHPAVALSSLFVLATILLWSFSQLRLLLPLLPFLGFGLAAGVDLLQRHARGRALLAVRAAVAVLVVFAGIRQVEPVLAGMDGEAGVTRAVSPMMMWNSALLVETAAWVAQHARAGDRLMLSQTAGVYLHTGWQAFESNPPESRVAGRGPAPFAVPGVYAAGRILHDSVTVIVLEHSGLRIERDLTVIMRACPEVLGLDAGSVADGYPAYYRVVNRDENCLHGVLAAAAAADQRLTESLR